MDKKKSEKEEMKCPKDLRVVESSYIMKSILLFLQEKDRLNMIMYNKGLQQIFIVDIEYYKNISGKYKIAEKNGKGKEYDINGELIFEGE